MRFIHLTDLHFQIQVAPDIFQKELLAYFLGIIVVSFNMI